MSRPKDEKGNKNIIGDKVKFLRKRENISQIG